MKDFERFKKKVLREHIIKSALVGLGVGLLAAALAIVISFLTRPEAAVWTGILAGVLFAGASGYYYWYKTKPSDKKIALRLDKKLGLHEKCATMIEFQEKQGAILDKQREDATTTLAEKPTKALKFSVGIWVIPALAVASAFFGASFLTPQNQNNPGPGYSDISNSDFDRDSVTSSLGDDALSVNSEHSGANDSFQEFIDSMINHVRDSLNGVSDADSRSNIVSEGKEAIDSFLDQLNSKDEIGKALRTEQDHHLKDQGADLIAGNIDSLYHHFQEMFNDLTALPTDEMVEYGNELADQIDDALAKAKAAGVSEDDALYQTYEELARRLRNLQDYTQDPNNSGEQQSGEQQSGQQQNNSKAQEAVESAIANAASKAANNVSEQNENEQLASAVKSIMDSMVNPQPGSEASGSGSGEQNTAGETATEGSGGSGSVGQTEGSGKTSGSAQMTEGSVDSGEPIDTSMSGEPQPGPSTSGEPQPGPGDSGSGAGPGQPGENSHTDIIYTGDQTVEYGSVIDSYGGAYHDDKGAGDGGDDGDTADDYFNNLFGSEGQGGGK